MGKEIEIQRKRERERHGDIVHEKGIERKTGTERERERGRKRKKERDRETIERKRESESVSERDIAGDPGWGLGWGFNIFNI